MCDLSGILVPASLRKMLLKAVNARYKIYLSAFLLGGGRHWAVLIFITSILNIGQFCFDITKVSLILSLRPEHE